MRKGTGTLVIGAGIAGLSIAYYLARAGEKVRVLDRGYLGTGASGDNLGQLSLLDRHEAVQFAWSLESMALYQALEEEEGVQTELCRCGGLLLLGSEEQKKIALTLMDTHLGRGVPVRYLDRDEIREVEPHFANPSILGALHCGWEGTIMPLKVVSGLIEAAERRGVRFSFRNEVKAFVRTGSRVKGVQTQEGLFEADRIILATGSWTRALCEPLGLDVPVYYHKGSALVTSPVPRYIRSVIVSGGFLLNRKIRGRVTGLGVAQHQNGSILIGQSTEPGNSYDRSLSVEGVEEMVRNFLAYFPDLHFLEIIRAWAGNTTYTTDGQPVYGFSERFSNLFIAAGLKGAFSTAPGAGKMAAELLAGNKEDVLKSWKIKLADFERMGPERSKEDNG
jgi:glycine/D-amino acid oxidase-like deaminating enzyme